MKFRIEHKTTYKYSEDVSLTQNHARLTPLNLHNQTCFNTQLIVKPTPDYTVQVRDRFANVVTVFEVPMLHNLMEVTAISEVEVISSQAHDLFAKHISWESVRNELSNPFDNDYLDALPYVIYTALTTPTQQMIDYALLSFSPNRSIIEACEDLMHRIYQDFSFDSHFSTINTPLGDVFEHKKGVCQDFAHLTIACLRGLGLAARYVSGYIETIPPPGQEKLIGADASHAWVSLFVPTIGWLDFDPTNNIQPQEQHVVLAVGRDFSDVTPLKGVMFGGGSQQLSVAVDMTRI